MARKSATQRLNELLFLREEYRGNHLSSKFFDWDIKFLDAMIQRMSRKKALTKNMRSKIDNLISEGVKKAPSSPEAENLENMATYLNKREADILIDFAVKIRKGWSLSAKQLVFKDKLVIQAKEIMENGHWKPSDHILKEMKAVVLISKSYASGYWYTHSAGDRAIGKIKNYIVYTESNQEIPPNYNITEKDWNSAKHAVRGKLKKLSTPRFLSGSKCFVRARQKFNTATGLEWKTINEFGIICSDAYVQESNGSIVYDVLFSGTCMPISCSNLYKR